MFDPKVNKNAFYTGEKDYMGRPIYQSNYGNKKFSVDEGGMTYPIETQDDNTQPYYDRGSYELGSGHASLIPDNVKIIFLSTFLILGFIGSCVPLETRRKIEDMFSMEKIEETIPEIQDMVKEKIENTIPKVQDIIKEHIEEIRKQFKSMFNKNDINISK